MQSAYKPHHNTESALIKIKNDLLEGVDKHSAMLLVLLDLSAAFDTVNHDLLLSFLENNIGIQGSALALLRSYLTHRSQKVCVNGVFSELSELLFGVPQGSVLGPLKFCIYTLPLGEIIRYHNLGFHIYADDIQLYTHCDIKNPEADLQRMRSCISDLRTWMIKNKLMINDEKTEFLVITQPHNRKLAENLSIRIGSSVVEVSPFAKNLGVYLDSCLSMDRQISHISQSCMFHLRNIASLRQHLSERTTATVINALVTSRLDYCNALLYGCPQDKLKRLQRIQNIAARVLTRTPCDQHITPLLKDLHWLPIRARVLFKLLTISHSCFYGSSPSYLCELVSFYNPTRHLRSSDHLLFKQRTGRLKTYGDKAFNVSAPMEWNSLPLSLRQIESKEGFKKELKTYLFKKFYM